MLGRDAPCAQAAAPTSAVMGLVRAERRASRADLRTGNVLTSREENHAMVRPPLTTACLA